jgi:hypothetical protein
MIEEARLPDLPAPQLPTQPTDIFVSTYPKCGTTWALQIAHQLRTRGDMEFDDITLVAPWIEMAPILGTNAEAPQVAVPRLFKTHLPWGKMPKGGKYIYIMRDPGDALVSFYHFLNGVLFERDAIDINVWGKAFFLTGATPFGDYWSHIRSWWDHRSDKDVLFLCFEDMKHDHEGAVRRIAKFMGLEGDEGRIGIATQNSTFAFMRAHGSRFDEQQNVLSLSRLTGLPSDDARMTKIRAGRVGESLTALSVEVRLMLDAVWKREIEGPLGVTSYEELRARLNSGG